MMFCFGFCLSGWERTRWEIRDGDEKLLNISTLSMKYKKRPIRDVFLCQKRLGHTIISLSSQRGYLVFTSPHILGSHFPLTHWKPSNCSLHRLSLTNALSACSLFPWEWTKRRIPIAPSAILTLIGLWGRSWLRIWVIFHQLLCYSFAFLALLAFVGLWGQTFPCVWV